MTSFQSRCQSFWKAIKCLSAHCMATICSRLAGRRHASVALYTAWDIAASICVWSLVIYPVSVCLSLLSTWCLLVSIPCLLLDDPRCLLLSYSRLSLVLHTQLNIETEKVWNCCSRQYDVWWRHALSVSELPWVCVWLCVTLAQFREHWTGSTAVKVK